MQIIIVDEFTGRTMPGRRWSDGLHQAIEAKEGLEIQNESVTQASISYQVGKRLDLFPMTHSVGNRSQQVCVSSSLI